MLGKTNSENNTLYGRVLRNENVDKCPVGILAMYLSLRFQITKELETIYFLKNKDLFFNKVYANVKEKVVYVNKEINDM